MLPLVIVEVFVLDPSSGFLLCLFLAHCRKSQRSHRPQLEDFFAHDMLMILCPSSNDWVQHQDQMTSRGSLMVLDDFSDFSRKAFTFFFDGLIMSLPLVLAYMLSQKVKAVLNMRDERFLSREGQSSFPHEWFNERFGFLLQSFFRTTGDNEVICISYQVDLCSLVLTISWIEHRSTRSSPSRVIFASTGEKRVGAERTFLPCDKHVSLLLSPNRT